MGEPMNFEDWLNGLFGPDDESVTFRGLDYELMFTYETKGEAQAQASAIRTNGIERDQKIRNRAIVRKTSSGEWGVYVR